MSTATTPQATAEEEVAGLEKVLTRLALTDGDKLERVLSKLIPAVVSSLKSSHDSTRKKVLEILSHVNKRVKSTPQLQLPLQELLVLFTDASSPPLVRNFALVYTEMAFERAAPADRLAAVGPLLLGLSARPAAHQAICLRVALAGLETFPHPYTLPTEITPSTLEKYAFLGVLQDRTTFLDYSLKYLLYQPVKAATARPAASPLQAAQQAQQMTAAAASAATAAAAAAGGGAAGLSAAFTAAAAAVNAAAAGAGGAGAGGGGAAAVPAEPLPVYPGLSPADVKTIEEKGVPAADVLGRRKLGILNFIAAAGLPPHETLVHLLAAACDPHDPVSRRGEELIKKLAALDSPKPAVNLEDERLVKTLYSLFHGNAEGTTLDTMLAVEKRRAAVALPLRARIGSLLCRSVVAANCFPAVVQTISECVFGASTNGRLKQAGLEFAVWVFKHAADYQLKAMGPTVLAGLIRSLDETAGASDATSTALRGFAYTAVGALAQRLPTLFHDRTDIARSFFSALTEEPPGLRATLQEAVGALAQAYKNLPEGSRGEINALLLQSASSNKDAVRLCAVQWAIKLFPFDHPAARYICILSAGDAKLEVREEGLRGLQLSPAQQQQQQQVAAAPHSPAASSGSSGSAAAAAAAAAALRWPRPAALLGYMHGQVPRLAGPWDPTRPLPMPAKSLTALIQFLALCRRKEKAAEAAAAAAGSSSAGDAMDVDGTAAASSTSSAAATFDAHASLLESALVREAGGDLVVAALEALLDLATDRPEYWDLATARFARNAPTLRTYSAHVSLPARIASAKILGVAAAGLSKSEAEALLTSLIAVVATVPPPAAGAGAGAGAGAATAAAGSAATATPVGVAAPSSKGSASARFEEQEGALFAAGYVLAQLSVTVSSSPDSSAPVSDSSPATAHLAAVKALVTALHSSHSLLAATAAISLGLVALRVPLQPFMPEASAAALVDAVAGPTAMLVDSTAKDGAAVPAPSAAVLTSPTPVGAVADAAATATTAGTAPAATTAAAAAPASAASATAVVAAAAPGSLQGMLTRVSELMADKEVKVAGRAVNAAGYLAHGMPTQQVLTPLLDGLFKLSHSKTEDIQFAVGEALSFAFGGVPITADRILHSNFSSLAEEFALLKGGVGEAPPGQGTAPSAVVADNAPADLVAARTTILDCILQQYIHHTRVEVRCGAVVWLVSLLTYCGGTSAVRALLPQIQSALSGLLGDPNELTQEMASRGVSLVYGLGDEATRKTLMDALVGVLQGGAQAKQAVKLSGDTQVFEEGTVGSLPASATTATTTAGSSSSSGGLSTYKELCALATDLGQPDLIYKFMDLAHHQQALNSRRGAAFGFAGIARLAGGQLGQHLGALVPKLYRYQYDPNPRVQEAMGAIWRALVDDPAAAVDAHFGPIMAELLREMGGRLWRNRQAGCAAMADLIQGRRWPDLAPHFASVWSMTLRCMDDIKESVRLAAISLARSLRSLTLRLVDPQFSPASDAAAAVAVALPLLLEQGLGSSVAEVRGVALDTLAKLAKAAGPEHLRPHLAALVTAMLEALSSLEDSRLNYIEQHAERLGFDNDRLEGARVNASRSSPMGDTLELCGRFTDPAALDALVPTLTGLLKRAVGLNTKVGTARFIRSLTMHGGSHLKPYSATLIKALTAGTRAERSGTVRKAYAGAVAQLARHAAPARIDKLVAECLGMYKESSSGSDERLVGGLLLKELLRGAPEAFATAAASILPTAFGAKMDEDAEVAAVWKLIWEEGVSSEAGAVRLYAPEIAAFILEGLTSAQWGRKKSCAEAVASMAEVGSDVIAPFAPALAATLLTESGGRLWEGKEKVVDAIAALCKACPAALEPDRPGHGKVLDALLSAAARKKATYVTAALKALESALGSFDGDHYSQVAPLLLDAVRNGCENPATATTPADAGQSATSVTAVVASSSATEEVQKPLPMVDCLHTLAVAVAKLGNPSSSATAVAMDTSNGITANTDATQSTTTESLSALVELIAQVLNASMPWAARQAALVTGQAALKRASELSSPSAVLVALASALSLGAARALTELKVGAVRLAALDLLGTIVKATSDGQTLDKEVAHKLMMALHEVAETEKAAAIASAASKLHSTIAQAHPF